MPDLAPAATETARIPLRPQDEVECRRCEVHCDRVVYPGACIARSCPFVYAYEAWGHTYMGCLQKVFDVEIDLDLLGELEARREGFGAVKARRTPLPMCRSGISACYEHREDEVGCRNPEFFELPLERPELPRLRGALGSFAKRESGRSGFPPLDPRLRRGTPLKAPASRSQLPLCQERWRTSRFSASAAGAGGGRCCAAS